MSETFNTENLNRNSGNNFVTDKANTIKKEKVKDNKLLAE